jgi:hypothetical protein
LLADMCDMNAGEQRAQQRDVHEGLARHCRHMTRLLGGAVHAELKEHAPAENIGPLLDDEANLVTHVNNVAELPIDL